MEAMVEALLQLLSNKDFWIGAGAGITIGILVGATWERAFELIEEAYEEHAMKNGNEPTTLYRKAVDTLTPLGLILVVNAVVWVIIGSFQVYAYTKASNFAQCQADYNQRSSIARQARTDAAATQNAALYAWIESLPKITGGPTKPPSPADIAYFRRTLALAIKTYRDSVQAQKENPYPPDPVDTCGNN